MKQSSTFVYSVALTLVLVSISVTAYFFGPITGAKFGLIDDHEIFRYLKGADFLSVIDFPSVLVNETEVGNWGVSPRFRPVFYVFKLLETAIFGLNPGFWFWWRLVILVVFLSSVALIAFFIVTRVREPKMSRTWQGGVVGLLAIFFAGVVPAWTGIVLRLGPSEIYVAWGLALAAWGSYLVTFSSRFRAGWLLLCSGIVIAAGSKEDALIFFLAAVALFMVHFYRIWADKVLVVISSMTVVFCAYVAIGLFIATSGASRDVYGEARSLRTVFSLLIGNPFFLLSLVPPLLMIAFMSSKARSGRSNSSKWPKHVFLSLSARQWTAVIACLLPLTVTLSEAYFYQNSYGELLGSTGGVSRYGLLTQIMGVMAILFVAIFALEKARTQAGAFLIIALSFATFIASWFGPVAKYGVLTYRDLSKQAADSSRLLGESMESAATTIRDSRSPVLILIQNPLDYEFAYSFPLYLHSYAGVKEVTLEFRVSPENLTDASMRNLVLSLQEMTKRGSFESGWLVKKGEPSHVAGTYSCVALSPLKTEVPEWCRSLSVLQ